MRDVIIVGGGLAGLISAQLLAKAGLDVLLLEKHSYPLHKVCGEYISNEVRPFLESIDSFPAFCLPPDITQFKLSSIGGQEVVVPLGLGGFGISRYRFDEFLCQKARAAGADVQENTPVQLIERTVAGYTLTLKGGDVAHCRLLIGAWGKRSRLDKVLDRSFMEQRSDYIGVKYHIRANLPHQEVALHNFPNGYCGVSKIEDDTWNLCYLGSRKRLRHWGSIERMEEEDLCRNPQLKAIFNNAQFLYEKPLVINEVNFSSKAAVQRGVLMAGDTAGLITPLCGNGMAMAIHSGKILAEQIIKFYSPANAWNQGLLEQEYKSAWQQQFARRLWVGRKFQQLFGQPYISAVALQLLRLKPLGRLLVTQTHGQTI